MTREKLSEIFTPKPFGIRVESRYLVEFLQTLDGGDLRWLVGGFAQPSRFPNDHYSQYDVMERLGEEPCVAFYESGHMSYFSMNALLRAGFAVYDNVMPCGGFFTYETPVSIPTHELVKMIEG